MDRYNAAGSWEQLPPMLARRSHPAVASLKGRLYVCGGFDGVERSDDQHLFIYIYI